MKANRGQLAAVGIALTFAFQWVHAAVQSEARTTVTMQTCAGPCVNEAFAFQEHLMMSHGQGSSPVSTAGFYPTPNGPTQYAYANADLPNSKLHVVASGQADSTHTRLYAAVAASIGDTFAVLGAPGLSRLSVDVTGTLQTFGNPTDYYLSASLHLLQPGSLDAFSRGDYGSMVYLASSYASLGGSDWGSPNSLTLPGVTELVFQTPAAPFEWFVNFAVIYTLTDSQSLNADLGHTLAVKFDAPAGAVVASASGYLPASTGWVAPVPEPSSALLLLAGLPLLARRLRRGHRERA